MSLPRWCGTPETHDAHDGCWGWPTPAAPAVPVGVQPEPAGHAYVDGPYPGCMKCGNHVSAHRPEPAEDAKCGYCPKPNGAHSMYCPEHRYPDWGAVPVVHPEPGDRAVSRLKHLEANERLLTTLVEEWLAEGGAAAGFADAVLGVIGR